MKLQQIRELDANTLKGQVVSLKAELAKEKARVSSGMKSEKRGNIRNTRRTLARIFTIMRERELGLMRGKKKIVQKKETEKSGDKKQEGGKGAVVAKESNFKKSGEKSAGKSEKMRGRAKENDGN